MKRRNVLKIKKNRNVNAKIIKLLEGIEEYIHDRASGNFLRTPKAFTPEDTKLDELVGPLGLQ